MTERRFECSCSWAMHSLKVEVDIENYEVVIFIVNAPSDWSFIQRIKGAFKVLRGREHVLSEIYVRPDDIVPLANIILSGLPESKST